MGKAAAARDALKARLAATEPASSAFSVVPARAPRAAGNEAVFDYEAEFSNWCAEER
jgi:hypothetical protein